MFIMKLHTCHRYSEGSNKLYAHQDLETPQRLRQNCLSVPVEVWVCSGLPQGQGLWVQHTWVWHKASWRKSPNPNRAARTYTRLGKQTLGGHKQNFVCTRTQETGVVTPQETDSDLPGSIQESLMEAWVDGGLLQGWGR